MVLDAKIQQVKEHFGCTELEHWQEISPAWITQLEGIGPATLDQIRLMLAVRGLTLLNDRTPGYWKEKLGRVRAGSVLADDEVAIVCPFTVIVDSAEQAPFAFEKIAAHKRDWTADVRWRIKEGLIEENQVVLSIPTQRKALGESRGDYSIAGHEGRAHVERKSIEDAQGTILGHGERHERFTRELEFLASIECKAVVVEGSLGQVLATVTARGKRSVDENRRSLYGQVLAWQQDYAVPWIFCDSRRLAEVTAFRILERYWRHERIKLKNETQSAGAVLSTL